MKLLFIASCLCLSLNASAFIGNVGHSTSLDVAGNPLAETVEKQFINVKASGNIAAGAVAALSLSADDGATVVTAPTTGLAPICIMVKACASGELCRCQTYGLIDAALFDVTNSSAVAGKRAWMSTDTAGYVSHRSTEVATEVPVGYFYDAATGSGSVQLFIKL